MNITASSNIADRLMPVLLVLFIGSGCSALIYEIVWFEMLRQVVGASSISLAIVRFNAAVIWPRRNPLMT